MAGGQETYPGQLVGNITTLFGIPLATVGLVKTTNGYCAEAISFHDPMHKIYRKFLLSGNNITGAILLGIVEDIGVIRNLMLNRVDLSDWKDELVEYPTALSNLYFGHLTKPWSAFARSRITEQMGAMLPDGKVPRETTFI